MRSFALLIASLILAGCASAGPTDGSAVARTLRERGLDPSSVVIPFEVTDEMRGWVRERVPMSAPVEKKLESILAVLVTDVGLGLDYEAGHTASAREVFASRKANCLGFTSLFVGLAREMKVPAFYLAVDDVERFARDGDLLVVSGHVSVGFDIGGGSLKILDFSDAPRAEYRRVRPLSDLTAIALYHSNVGAELLRTGRAEEALPWLEKATVIDPNLGDSWVNLGVGLRRLRDFEGAERAYRRALEADPETGAAYQNLATLLRVQGRGEEADKILTLSAQASSHSPFSYLALGDLSLANGRPDEARRFYHKALRLSQEDPEPYAALGLVALARGDRGEARKWLNKAANRDRENNRVRKLAAQLEAGEAGRKG